MRPKDAELMTNSETPDQTALSEAVCSVSVLFARTYFKYL